MGYVANAVRAPKTLSPAEQKLILKVSGEHAAGFRDHMMFSLALGTGLRESEIAALNIGDVYKNAAGDVKTKIDLRVFKGHRSRKRKPPKEVQQRAFLPKIVRAKLRKYLTWKRREGEPVAPDAPLFLARVGGGAGGIAKGKRISDRSIRYAWIEWQKRAKFEVLHPFHRLRHTCLSNLYAATKDLRLVQEQARHAHVTTTEIYAAVSDETVRRAVDELPG